MNQLALPAPLETPASGRAARTFADRLIDWWVVLLLTVPLYNTFYPPETYFANFSGTYGLEPIKAPITPTLLVIISLSLWPLFARARRNGRIKHEWLAYLFIAWAAASVAWSPDPATSFRRAIRLIPPVTLGLLLPQLYSPSKLVRLMLVAFAASACCSLFMGVFVPQYGLSKMTGGYESAMRGAIAHKNSAGLLYALGVSFGTYHWFANRPDRILASVTIVVCLAMVVAAQSATAVVALAITLASLVAVGILQRLEPGVRGVLLMLIVVIALLALAAVLATPDVLVGIIGRDLTFTGRTAIWEAVLQRAWLRPLTGYGFGFWLFETPERTAIWNAIGYPAPHSHNSWIDLMLQFGLIGTVLFGAFAGTLLLRGIVSALRGSSHAPLPLAVVMMLLIRSYTEVEFTEPSITATMFWLMWASASLRPRAQRHRTLYD